MDPLIQTRLHSLMKLSSGNPDITIGVIDGPVDFNHAHLTALRLELLKIRKLVHVKMLTT